MKIEDFEKQCKLRKKRGATQAELIQFLYDAGASIIDSILIMRSLYDVSLGKAKQIVTAHPCWDEVVESADKLHEALIRELEQEAKAAPSEVKS